MNYGCKHLAQFWGFGDMNFIFKCLLQKICKPINYGCYKFHELIMRDRDAEHLSFKLLLIPLYILVCSFHGYINSN